ncbi:MAG: cytochrome c-553 [Halobacteriovoraceae bacterium]|jgi:cytochrome subunit of sulfide dehydrogenase|nr:cytochrome c-553 [Halobacteriovoraceae bacterium]
MILQLRLRLSVILISLCFGVAHALSTEAIIQDCNACHGIDGASMAADIPIIGGFSDFYITDVADVYRDRERPCEEVAYPAGSGLSEVNDMCKVFDKLSDKQIQAVAEHYASKPFVSAIQSFDAVKAKSGSIIHKKYCEKCHTENGSAADDDAGILAGQWMQYMETTFNQFDSNQRSMPSKMKRKYNKLSAADKEALIHFYASQN